MKTKWGFPLSLFGVIGVACTLAVSAEKPTNPPSQASTEQAAHPLLLKQQVPKSVTAKEARKLENLPASRTLELSVSLPPRNESELDELLKQLYDPLSPRYGHYLTPEQFTERFGPARHDYDRVVSWARANGFEIRRITPSRRVLSISGSIDTINRALHVKMGIYQHPTEKRTFYAPDREPTLDLDVPVYSIAGLTDYLPPRPVRVRDTSEQTTKAQKGGSGPKGAFTPGDIRKAYVGDSPLTGKGQTIGIVSYAEYSDDDQKLYYEIAGITSPPPLVKVQTGGEPVCLYDCDSEPVADVGNAVGVASGLEKIILYEGSDPVAMLDRIASDNEANIISSSFSMGVFGKSAHISVYQQLAAQGQTFIQASGDVGAYPSDETPPILNPYVLNVGGTILATDSQSVWQSEDGWPSSGGGFDVPGALNGYPIPDYQQLAGVINSSNGGSTRYRNGPDVAAEASNDFTVQGKKLITFNGTSVAAPRWAAFLALVNEARQGKGLGPVGFINPLLYQLGRGPLYDTYLHDITKGNNGHPAVAGYDLVTGWGSPKPAFFVSATLPLVRTPENGGRYIYGSPFIATVDGYGRPGAMVKVVMDGNPFCDTRVGSDAAWSCTPSQAIMPGNHALSVTQAIGSAQTSTQVKFAVLPVLEED